MILRREGIDTGIDADVANMELRILDKVRYLICGSSAEAACRKIAVVALRRFSFPASAPLDAAWTGQARRVFDVNAATEPIVPLA